MNDACALQRAAIRALTYSENVISSHHANFSVAHRLKCSRILIVTDLSEMAGKQAKTLSTDHIDDLLFFAERSRHPQRNRLIVLLSVKAGLRAAEIAKLTWEMVLGPSGEVGSTIELQDKIAKKGSGRSIPLHVDLREALAAAMQLGVSQGPVIRSQQGGAMTPLSIVVWFHRAFKVLDLKGCSSHSGRRTFITRAARLVHSSERRPGHHRPNASTFLLEWEASSKHSRWSRGAGDAEWLVESEAVAIVD
jgi:integrase